MIIKRFVIIFSTLLVLGLLSGCASQYSSSFFDQAASKGWTADQKLAAWANSYRLLFADKTKDNRWVMDYSTLSNDDMINAVNAMRGDIDQILSNIRWMRLVRAVDMEQPLLREEAKLKSLRDRLILGSLNRTFFQKIGEIAVERDSADSVDTIDQSKQVPDYSGGPLRTANNRSTGRGQSYFTQTGDSANKTSTLSFGGAYDIKIIWPQTDLTRFVFEPTYIAKAREAGQLQQYARYLVYDSEQSIDDIVSGIQDGVTEQVAPGEDSFVIVALKIFDPDALNDKPVADMIEVYRLTETELDDGSLAYRREPLPFMRGYRSLKGSTVDTWVVDIDKEGEPGYGLPNEVHTIGGVKTARDLYKNEEREFAKYREYEKPVEKRELPEEKEITLDIVRAGDITVDLWQRKDAGWTVPFPYITKTPSGNPDFHGGFELDDSRHLLYVEKRWGKSVVERYKLKPKYADKEYEKVLRVGRQLVLQPAGEFEMRASVDVFSVESAYEIEYEFNGNTYILRDDDGDGVFEKRKVESK